MSTLPWLRDLGARVQAQRAVGRLPHALLLTGMAGLGQQVFARALAADLHCQTGGSTACGRCEGCRQFAAGTHADHREVSLEVNEDTGRLRQQILIEQVRDCCAALWLTARYGGWKTAIIEPAESMSAGAANALLKTLEEPPRDTLILLVSARPTRIPATLRSRCQRLDLPVPARTEALAWLAGHDGRRADWDTWLDLAGGAPLAALALGQSGLAARRAACAEALQAVLAGRADPLAVAQDWARAHDKAERRAEGDAPDREPDDVRAILAWWITVVADLIRLAQAGPAARLANADLRTGLQSMGQRLHLRPLHRFHDAMLRSQGLLETTVNRQSLLDALLIAWAAGLDPTALQPLPQDD